MFPMLLSHVKANFEGPNLGKVILRGLTASSTESRPCPPVLEPPARNLGLQFVCMVQGRSAVCRATTFLFHPELGEGLGFGA